MPRWFAAFPILPLVLLYIKKFSSQHALSGDGVITGFDSYLTLFDAAGKMLFLADESSNTFADGSINVMHAARAWTFSQAGTYMITIGQGTCFEHEALQGYERKVPYDNWIDGENIGAWRLTMNVTNGTLSQVAEVGAAAADVPEPASLLLGAGFAGLAASRRKKPLAA